MAKKIQYSDIAEVGFLNPAKKEFEELLKLLGATESQLKENLKVFNEFAQIKIKGFDDLKKVQEALSGVDRTLEGLNETEKQKKIIDTELLRVNKLQADSLKNLTLNVKENENAVKKTAMSWSEFIKGKMGPYMKELGSHGAAIAKIGEEWKIYKQTLVDTGVVVEKVEKSTKNLTNTEIKELKIKQEQEKLAQQKIKTANLEAQQVEKNRKESARLAREQLGLTSAYSKLNKQLNELRAKWKDLAAAEQQNTKEGRVLLNQITQLDNKLKKIDAGVGQFQRNVGNYTSAFRGLSNVLGAAGLTLGLVGVFNVLKNGFNIVKEFQKGISELSAITGATGKDLDYLRNSAIQMAADVGDSAKNIVEAFKLVGSAKPELLSNVRALKLTTEAVITLSKASGGILDLSASALALTQIMNQFGASADQANKFINILGAGAKFGSVEIPYLQEAIVKVGTTANSAGLSIEQLTAMMELFGEKGIVAEKAGTGFKKILVTLQKDTKNYTNGVFDLNKAIENNLSISKDNIALQEKFGEHYFDLAQILFQNKDRFNALTESITGTNVAFEQAAINMDNLAGDIDKAGGAWDEFVLSIENGEGVISKVFRAIITTFTDVISAFSKLNKSAEQLIQSQAESLAEAGFVAVQRRIDKAKKISKEAVKDVIKTEAEMLSKRNESILKQMDGIQADIDKYSLIPNLLTEPLKIKLAEQKLNLEAQLQANLLILKRLSEFTKTSEKINDAEVKSNEDKNSKITKSNKNFFDVLFDKLKILHENNRQIIIDNKEIKQSYDLMGTSIYGTANAIETIDNVIYEFNKEEKKNRKSKKQQEIDEVNDKYNRLLAMAIANGIDQKELKEIQNKELRAIDRKYTGEMLEQGAEVLTTFLEKQTDKRIELIDKEIAAHERKTNRLEELAQKQVENANENLAFEQLKSAELERKREKILQRQKRFELGLTAIKTYGQKLEQGDQNALTSTIRDTTLLLAFVNSLPAFIEGMNGKTAEDILGKPHLNTGKDDYIVRIDKDETVLNPSETLQYQQLMKLNDIPIKRQPIIDTAWKSNAMILNELSNIKQSIENKPTYLGMDFDKQENMIVTIIENQNKRIINHKPLRIQ